MKKEKSLEVYNPFENVEYKSNPNLRHKNVEVNISPEMFKEYTSELIKCKNDPIYFAENYYTIISPQKGKHIIEMYDKQKELLKFLINEKRCCILSARQTGKCLEKNTKIRVKNKKTNKISEISIKDFFDKFDK